MPKKKKKVKKPKRSKKPKKQKSITKKLGAIKRKIKKQPKSGKAKKPKIKRKSKGGSLSGGKKSVRAKKGIQISIPLNFGNIAPDRQRIMVLVVAIIFVITGMFFSSVANEEKGQVAGASTSKGPTPMEREIRKMVKGYPIEKMTPYIANKDPKVAAFLVAIAKKESNWGKHKPVLEGKDCYNYWGFRMKTADMGSGGHTCFDSPREAVNVVASRIDELVNEEKLDSPKEMVVWKCGSDCSVTGGQEAAEKWISDVGYYYNKFSEFL